MNLEQRQPHPAVTAGILAALALVTLCIFWSILSQGFIYYDDPQYVLDNQPVQQGLTWSSFVWSLSSEVQGNWHPVTMWSHMLDCQLFGLQNPGGHHFTSLVIHVMNALMLFWFLRIATGNVFAAAFVAALFAWHPTRVESVAWVSERKDVLSTFFWFSMLLAYVHYTRSPGWLRYALVFVLLALGLMSKPMLVTAPFLLLLLDVWPLARLWMRSTWKDTGAQLGALVLEKLPLMALSAASSIITFRVQRSGGFVVSLQRHDFGERLINVVDTYGNYLFNTFWPTQLALMYSLPREVPITNWTIVSAAILVVVSALSIVWIRKRPYFFVGWFWFLGTLVPVIGLVKVGAQSMADRYTYVPMVGLFIIVAWGGQEVLSWISPQILRRSIAVTAGGVVLLLLAGLSVRQVSFWENELTLYSRPLEVSQNNYLAHYNYGNALANSGRFKEALEHYSAALELEPEHSGTYFNAGSTLALQGRCTEALPYYRNAIQYGLDNARAWYELAYCEQRLAMLKEASAHYQQALKHDPDMREARLGLGNVLARQGDTTSALAIYTNALGQWPSSRITAARLIWLLSTHSDEQYRDIPLATQLAEAVRASNQGIDAASIEVKDSLAAAFAAAGRFDEALPLAAQAYSLARAQRIQAEEQGWEEGVERAAVVEQAIADRIELYQAGKEFRQDPVDAPY